MKLIGLISLISVVFFLNCKKVNTVSMTAYIIGDTNDIKSLENDGTVSSLHRYSAALITTVIDGDKKKFCSGTLIDPEDGEGEYRVLTNNHCFLLEGDYGTSDNGINSNSERGSSLCQSLKVFFGFEKGQTEQSIVRECKQGSLRSDSLGDLAIFTLKSNPSLPYKPATLSKREVVASGIKASVVHFPSLDSSAAKDGEMVFEKRVGYYLPVAQVTVNDCNTLGDFSNEEQAAHRSLKVGFKHSCDQIKGSSGSSLWDVERQEIIGVNWGGVTLNYGSTEEKGVFNIATHINYVRNFVNGKQDAVLKDGDNVSDVVNKSVTAASVKSKGSKKKSNPIEKVFCGALGGVGNVGGMGGWFGLLLFSLPVFLCFVGGKRLD